MRSRCGAIAQQTYHTASRALVRWRCATLPQPWQLLLAHLPQIDAIDALLVGAPADAPVSKWAVMLWHEYFIYLSSGGQVGHDLTSGLQLAETGRKGWDALQAHCAIRQQHLP